MRIAMWSGPRNLSTALMYAFAQRRDMTVIDEPFYGPYLRRIGLRHPMHDAILQSRPQDAETVEQMLRPPSGDGATHVYQKHMCQHMIAGMPRGFMADCANVFLIRHPVRVAASFLKGYRDATPDDLGFRLQAELYEQARALGQSPTVIDSADIRAAPEAMLRALCAALGLEWDAAMLRWPEGPKPYDGVWAAHWYGAVHRSTGFAPPEGDPPADPAARRLATPCMPYYERLSEIRLRA